MKNYLYTHQLLFESIERLKTIEKQTIFNALKLINNILPDTVIIGGMAVASYTKRNLTPDIDFIIKNKEYAKQILTKQNIEYKNLIDGKNEIIGLTIPEYNTDLLFSNEKELNNLIIEASKITRINGIKCNIAAPELLLIMKLDLSRAKDIDDAFKLVNSCFINKNRYLNALEILKPFLEDYDILEMYSGLLK